MKRRETAHEKALDLFFFSRLRFEANELRYLDHDKSPVVQRHHDTPRFSVRLTQQARPRAARLNRPKEREGHWDVRSMERIKRHD